MSLLVICEITGAFVNTLTLDEKYEKKDDLHFEKKDDRHNEQISGI